MKTSWFLSYFILTCVCAAAQVQVPEKKIKKINIREFYSQVGFSVEQQKPTSIGDFKKLAPGSKLLETDLTPYQDGTQSTSDIYPVFSMMMCIRFANKEQVAFKRNPLLRIGVSYSSGRKFSQYYFNEERKTYDTLNSAQNGSIIYFMDSVFIKRHDHSYSADQLDLDASLIYRTPPAGRWYLFSGMGILAGMSMDAHTIISYDQFDVTEMRYPNSTNHSNYYYYEDYGGSTYQVTELYRNKPNYNFSFYVPMGFDFRMGMKREFWRRLHAFYEFRAGLNIRTIPELGTQANGYIHNGVGFRLTWE